MSFVALNGIQLYYEEKGTGPVVLLIGGLASDSQSWLTVMNQLSKSYRVVAFDNRCCGRTQPELPDISIEQMADDAAALLRHLQVEEAIVVGHSMGGFIAMTLALRYPSLVKKLVLEATSASVSARNKFLFGTFANLYDESGGSSSWFLNLFFWLFHPSFFEKSSVVEAAVDLSVSYSYNPSRAAFRRQIECIGAFMAGDLAAIHIPVLVMAGSHDLVFDSKCATGLAAEIPHAKLVVVEGAGHALHVDQLSEFMRQLRSFIEF
ncbi:MAG: alpha/beta hydrolase [Bacteroidales bacterium]|nr:alpha/beta hydrolase [Bacteroidales bacterium]MDD3664333.1 alpha/beta hydrolase [Bacteroidales bacterium]